MKVYQSLEELSQAGLSFGLALGVFDGVHLGHQAVIDAARGLDLVGVLTFEPHPVQVLAPSHAPRRILASRAHKEKVLASIGVDFMVVINFTHEFSKVKAADFARDLCQCGARKLAAGEDWVFGKNRAGDMTKLAEWGKEYEVEVVSVLDVKIDGERISSTRIRHCLREGALEEVASMLGRPYSVSGEVVKGRQLGREIGFPTANVEVAEEQLPPNGVYRIRGVVDGEMLDGVANIGTRPTVDNTSKRSLEVHLFSDGIPQKYGWSIEVGFVEKIREERRFESLEELTEQISKDVAVAKKSLS